MPRDLIDRVAAIVREVSAEVIEPRFGALADDERHDKSPGEVVTVADTEAEALLIRRLADVDGSIPIVGEEGCAADPALVDRLEGTGAWLVDPVDGTANFAAGHPDWAVMVALVHGGTTVASWIWRPVDGAMYVAERGAGATRNGDPLRRGPAPVDDSQLRGAVLRRFLQPATAARVEANSSRLAAVGTGRGCAGVEYPALVEGDQDFVVFWRTLPWDHAPGALLADEAGAVVARPDGAPYRPSSGAGRTGRAAPPVMGLIAAADDRTWAVARGLLD